ncbi:MAG: NupC/NupG family nucleoside CNT transporter [Deltaproteobacteria bacterium]|nr:NupC/NupG family nucleoside CNT transporter [Deltaproteobacteria bacterium]
MSDLALRGLSGLGFVALLGLAWLLSSDRRAVDRRMLGRGIAIQLGLAAVLLGTPVGRSFFSIVERPVAILIDVSEAGARFVFGPLLDVGPSFALGVLPIIVVVGSLFGTLYFLGWIQPLVRAMARLFTRAMHVSGAEALAAVANVFVGMTEAGLVVRPYLARMTRSELFSFMTVGMSTIAGSVLVAYSMILGPGYAGHLVVASLLSAPAGLVVAKLMVPETEVPETRAGADLVDASTAHNLVDAAAEGGLMGLRLALNIGALLVAFVALVALANHAIGAVGGLVGAPEATLQSILGWLLAPIAFLMGVPWNDAREIGGLIGVKTIVNEFIAYQDLAALVKAGAVSERSAVIAAYALCGFANFGSLAILLGGIDGIAPERRAEAAALGVRSIVAGTIATCLTGCLAGLFV